MACATRLKSTDVVIVGLGWTGGILSKELSEAGFRVVALERGVQRSTDPDFAVPLVRDELRFAVRHELMQNPVRDTLTFRNRSRRQRCPMRRLGSFLPGEGVGGAGVHWNGQCWRWTAGRSRHSHPLRGTLRQSVHPGGHERCRTGA